MLYTSYLSKTLSLSSATFGVCWNGQVLTNSASLLRCELISQLLCATLAAPQKALS